MKAQVKRSLLAAAIVLGLAHGPTVEASGRKYKVTLLPSNGGAVSRGNSINNRGWVSGYSSLADGSRHATLWLRQSKTDLGTLGGPNSSVAWPVKNNHGLIVGIAQTATPEPLGENWSCSAFFTTSATGFTCLGFVWRDGAIRPLPTLGGNNGYASGANDRGQIVGWAESTVHDASCVPPQVLQFRAAVWGREGTSVRELPLIAGDSSSAATAINNRGQVVGISGSCDQAVGRFTARHAVLWEDDTLTDIGSLGNDTWNTPTAINERGEVVGFASLPGSDPDDPILHAFLWTERGGMQDLGTLPGDASSQAQGINARGQVVGLSCGAAGCRAFVWDDGVMTDLNTLVAGSASGRLEMAMDINDRGEITGRAVDGNGLRPAFLAVPVAGHR
jgi:probable HAF family extracellular repeat protein